MLSIPDDALREIAKRLTPEERQILRTVSRKFARTIVCEHVNLLHYGASIGSIEICEIGLSRLDDTQDTCVIAATHGHLEVLMWARKRGHPWTKKVTARAAKNDHLHILKWTHAAGCPPYRKLCEIAASRDNREILAWAQNVGYSWQPDICMTAAVEGNLELLKWLRDGALQTAVCPWDKWTCIGAADWKQFHVLEWALLNGCPCDTENIISWYGPGYIPENILALIV